VALALGPATPGPVVIGALLLAGAAAGAAGGAAWIAVPAAARAWLGTSEIITTLLLNYVALLMRYLIFGSFSPWRDTSVEAAAIDTLSGASHRLYPSWDPKAHQKP
jgi:simple sugar transport system permease protein